MRRTGHGLIAVAFLVLGATRAVAGIADSPLPVLLPGSSTLHLYSVPGVMNDAGTNLGTFFSCTSTSTLPQTVGVEVFADTGGGPLNNAATTAQTVPAGGTVTFGTVVPTGLWTSVSVAAPAMPRGSARILSTSKSLVCTAFIADISSTPVSGWQLTIIAKTKQKAAN